MAWNEASSIVTLDWIALKTVEVEKGIAALLVATVGGHYNVS